jgi:hypothetical protein
MKGDRALLCPKIISAPKSNKRMIIGASHHAFLAQMNSQNSPTNPLFLIKLVISDLIY